MRGFGHVMFVYVQYVPVHVYMRKKLRQLLNKLLRQHISMQNRTF